MPTTLIFRIEKVHADDPDPLTPEEEEYLNQIEQNILVLSDTLDQMGGKQRIFPKRRVNDSFPMVEIEKVPDARKQYFFRLYKIMGIPETVRTGPNQITKVKAIRITGESPDGGFQAKVLTVDGGSQVWMIRAEQIVHYLKGTIEKKVVYD
ncbi:MAG: hypothetical protein O6952_10840 [Planctomycetota bacterium]|nr:hypothetical protein [Planctomycetota bacterium]